jgi:hypothetical protein
MSAIENEFREIIQNKQNELSLREFANLSNQMNEAGYTYWVKRTEKGMTLLLEKPTLLQLIQRLISKITFKQLKLTSWQKYVYRQEIHFNYKNKEFNSSAQLFKRYHCTTPNWVQRAIGYPTKTYYAKGVVEHG